MEKILAFQVRETDLQKLKGISASMRIKLVVIDKVDFRQTVNDLLSQKKNPLVDRSQRVCFYFMNFPTRGLMLF